MEIDHPSSFGWSHCAEVHRPPLRGVLVLLADYTDRVDVVCYMILHEMHAITPTTPMEKTKSTPKLILKKPTDHQGSPTNKISFQIPKIIYELLL